MEQADLLTLGAATLFSATVICIFLQKNKSMIQTLVYALMAGLITSLVVMSIISLLYPPQNW